MRAQAAGRPEAALLAAVHVWAARHLPRIDRLHPVGARPGDAVLIEGGNLDDPHLRVHFGEAETWALPVSARAAVAVVPLAAVSPAPVWVSRQGLRSNVLAWGGPPDDDGPAAVVRIDPRDGAAGVFRDAPVVVTLSHPIDPATLSEGTLVVRAAADALSGRTWLSPDGRVIIWTSRQPLVAGAAHHVALRGLKDARGRDVEPHQSCFTPCDLLLDNLPP